MIKGIFHNIKNNKILVKALKNTNWLVGEKILVMALNLGVIVILARELGPHQFGELNYLLALVALFSPFTRLGLSGLVTREVINNPDQEDKVIATALGFRLLATLSVFTICLFVAPYYFTADTILLKGFLVLAGGHILTAFNVTEFWFEAKVISRFVVKIRFLVTVLFATLKCSAALLHAELIVFIVLFGFEMLFTGISLLAIYLYKSRYKLYRAFDFFYGVSLIRQSGWLILSGIASVIYLKIDQVMLAEIHSTEAVGIYSVASRLSEVWYFFPNAVVASFFAAMMAARNQGSEQYQQRLQNICDGLFISALILAIVVSFIAEPLILTLYGSAYREAAPILIVHIWAALFVFMRALLSKWLLAENLLKFSLLSQGGGAVVNVILNLLLIPSYGALGAAYATVISYASASYLVLFINQKTRPMAFIMSRSLCFFFYSIRRIKQ